MSLIERTPLLRFPNDTLRRRGDRPNNAVAMWVLVCCAAIPVLLTAAWAVAGVVQPSATYSPMRQTVSVLAGYASTHRWIVTVALIVCGGCYLAAAAGLPMLRRSARIALIVSALASVGIALCPEPVVGSTPQHMLFTTIGASVIAILPILTARRGPGVPVLLSVPVAIIVTALFLAMLGWLLTETQNGSMLGLAERLDSSIQITWPFLVAMSLLRITAPAGGTGDAPPDADSG